jgi:hypothetical protein
MIPGGPQLKKPATLPIIDGRRGQVNSLMIPLPPAARPPGPNRAAYVRALADLLRNPALPPTARRNAALALAKLGSADPAHRAVLVDGLTDADLSVRATCRWAMGQMALPVADSM